MPATSKKQQRFMGMVHAVQKGEMSAPSKEVAQAAKSMKPQDAKDFASTKHKGLPEKKEAQAMRKSALGILGSLQAKRLAGSGKKQTPGSATLSGPKQTAPLSTVAGRTALGQESQMTQRGQLSDPRTARAKMALYVRYIADKAAASHCGGVKAKKKKQKQASAEDLRLVKLAKQLERGRTMMNAINEVYGDKPRAYRDKVALSLYKGFRAKIKKAFGEATSLGVTKHPSGMLNIGSGGGGIQTPKSQTVSLSGAKTAKQKPVKQAFMGPEQLGQMAAQGTQGLPPTQQGAPPMQAPGLMQDAGRGQQFMQPGMPQGMPPMAPQGMPPMQMPPQAPPQMPDTPGNPLPRATDPSQMELMEQ